jgi:spore germination cell wall hydrolase CwlJ-like protein
MKDSITRRAKIERLFQISKRAMWPAWAFPEEEEPAEETALPQQDTGAQEALVESLASILMGEGVGEGPEGMRAIYHVILNRASKTGIQPIDVARDRKQFSILDTTTVPELIAKFKNDPNPNVQRLWQMAKGIVMAPGGDNTAGATHYYAGPSPYWATEKNPCWVSGPKIGRHQFGQDRSHGIWGNVSTGRCYIDKPETHPKSGK